nr:2OG-Fe dioxygenase family protein [Pseudomonas corrugata]
MPKVALAEAGYVHYIPKMRTACSAEDILGLRREFERLERDDYAPSGTNRFRRYGNGVLLPWEQEGRINWLPSVRDAAGRDCAGYDQAGHNPDHQEIRNFPALSDEVKENSALIELIREDYSMTFWSDQGQQLPVYFGVHFIKLTSTGPGEPGISSPNCFHQDGEPFTFAHLIHRSGDVEGGVNYIGRPCLRDVPLEQAARDEIISEFTLTEPLESFTVHDPKVTHFVSPVTRPDDGSDSACERCIVLVDFSPTVQRI